MEDYNEHSINRYSNGNIFHESYYRYNLRHRTDGPAFIQYYMDGSVMTESYWINDNYHRVDGPAVYYYNRDGTVVSYRYYLFDICIPESDFNTPGFVDAFILEHS